MGFPPSGWRDAPDYVDDYDTPPGPRHKTAAERDAFHDGRAFTAFWVLLTAFVMGPLGWFLHKWVA